MEEQEKTGGEQYEHICFEVDGRKIWIRRKAGQSEKAEIITSDPGAIEHLTALAKENPDIVDVLTEEGEENFHCVVGGELSFHLIPASGGLEFWVETLEE